MDLKTLQKRHPQFVYQRYSYKISGKDLKIVFYFKIQPDIYFRPKVAIKNISKKLLTSDVNNLVFHLGLIEMVSYWKATCSPKIIIKAGYLNKEQIKWWRDLIERGMGQFFFENKIPFQKPKIEIATTKNPTIVGKIVTTKKTKNRYLIPIGGGKDSAVTLELLKKFGKNIRCFSLNPTEPALKIMRAGQCQHPIIVRRKIDKKLLELNQKGYLNGHTPFSAYLAFLTLLAAVVFDYKYIAFSNERSSNEGNVKYLGRTINHQWSKSFEFEKKFRKYVQKYLTSGVDYFSFLRPLYEIQIAKIFSKYPKYFSAFLSCNEAYKTASGTKKPAKKWCGKCPKCLFVFAVLYPFLGEKKLVKIFKKNLLRNKSLLPLKKQLVGERGFKPFECVGTKKESKAAFDHYEKQVPIKFLKSWSKRHHLPKELEKILKIH